MLNIAIASAFLLSLVLSPGLRIAGLVVDLHALQILSTGQRGTVLALLGYWLPATLLFLVLRFVPNAKRFAPTKGEGIALTIGNLVLFLYVVARTVASTVQGGGAGFVVASFSIFTSVPALILVGITLVKIIVRAASVEVLQAPSSRLSFGEWVAFALIGCAPILYAFATLMVGTGSPFQVSRNVERQMAILCPTAVETVIRRPEGVEGIFLAQDGAMRYGKIERGTFGSTESGILGEPLVNGGLLRFFETPKRSRTGSASPLAAYERFFVRQSRQPVDELLSQYGVYRTKLTIPDNVALGTDGYEVAIKAIPSGEVLATSRYFLNRNTRRICGPVVENSIDERRFILSVLKLERRFESLSPKGK